MIKLPSESIGEGTTVRDRAPARHCAARLWFLTEGNLHFSAGHFVLCLRVRTEES